MGGIIDWKSIEDRTRYLRSVGHWESPQDIINSAAATYAIDKWQNQAVRPEVWAEKDALLGVIERVCATLDVACFSCRGFNSLSEIWKAGQRFIQYAEDGQQIKVFYLGDYDPSGLEMSRDIEKRLHGFLSYGGYGYEECFTFERIALTKEQVLENHLPPNYAKKTDKRFPKYENEHGSECWELDALSPSIISTLIEKKVTELRNGEKYSETQDAESQQKKQLVGLSTRWSEVSEFLQHTA
jgi:hypothetical protein